MTYEEFCKALDTAATSEARAYDPDAFPGSAQWRKCNTFTRQIRELKEQNPEFTARRDDEEKAARQAKIATDYDQLSEFAKMGS